MRRSSIYRKVSILVLLTFTMLLSGFTNEPSPNKQRVAVLTFHAVSRDFMVNPLFITQSELENTFKLMKKRGYNPISLNKFHNFIDGRESVPDKAVLITFDDGYENNYLLGYPLAKEYNVPAVIFCVAKWFSDLPLPETRLPHITKAQAETMLSEGLWTIASHSFDGHRKVQGPAGPGAFYTTKIKQKGHIESEAAYRARLAADVTLSAVTLKKIGVEPVDFSFPFGAYNNEAKEVLAESGFKYFFTNRLGLNKPGQDPHQIYRIHGTQSAILNVAVLDYYFAHKR